jgi:4-amino-4-deoxy-L-arabinose transferase-like glycosyltransferase
MSLARLRPRAGSRLAGRRIDPVLILILLAALGMRLYLATSREYIHDEINTAIPLSKTISFDPARLHLPLRGENHGALPAYVVKISSILFGTSRLGYRGMHLLLGLLTVVMVYGMTRLWYGPGAARWAAAFMAFNEYYLDVSSRATAHVPNLLFVTGAVYAFSRFLATERPRYLYLAGASVGVAFYCKESTALLLPVFALTLLLSKYRQWLLRPQVYLAIAVYFLVISPDIFWNLRANPDTATVTYNNQTVGQATYSAHLRRVGGLGFSLYPSMFYLRSTVRSAYFRATGRELRDETTEYSSVNPAIGVLLLGAVLITTVRPPRREQLRIFLLVMFWAIFSFFTLIKRGDPPGRLDPVSWIWVEITIVPAIVLAGARLSDVSGKWRLVVWTAAVLALATACAQLVLAE